ncbi:MAG: DUF3159 domain-containing protein [Antricoccus sp.]
MNSSPPLPEPPPDAPPPPIRNLVVDSIGGWRGIFDSGLPAVAFVVANLIGGLPSAIWAGVGAAVLIFLVRLMRHQKLQQAVSGLLVVAICVLIAKLTGQARGFFLLGIVRSGVLGLIFVGSALVRWPLVGLIWNFLSPAKQSWRSDRKAMRVYTWTSIAWGATFLVKFALEGLLYRADSATGLGVFRVVMGYPLTFGLVALTFFAVRTVRSDIPNPIRRSHGSKPRQEETD